MTSEVWEALQATASAEVLRRTTIIGQSIGIPPFPLGNAVMNIWKDWSGQRAVWYFTTDGRILLTTIDHETSLNMAVHGDYTRQRQLYDGVPDDLLVYVRNGPDTPDHYNLVQSRTQETIYIAGGVFWYDGRHWHIADGLAEHCRREGLDLFAESGFDYCLDFYRFGRDFTPEALVDDRVLCGEFTNPEEHQEALAEFRELFAAYT